MTYLIDADTLAFSAASMAEGMTDVQCIWNVNNMLEKTLDDYNIRDYQLFLTGEGNFRYKIYPEYKANRLKTPRPTLLGVAKQHLIDTYGASLAVGREADDDCGIVSTEMWNNGQEFTLFHIDKDLDQLPGKHVSPEIIRLGVVVRPAKTYYVSPQDGMRFFYKQLLTGDPTDNIKGVPGIGKAKAEKLFTNCNCEQDYIEAIRPLYSCDEELLLNARCLWLQRYEGEMWEIPQFDSPREQGEGQEGTAISA